MDWEIFRGDMFQLEVLPENALRTAIEIKAGIRQIKDLDVRMAIGIGSKEYRTSRITESNGAAYSNSGICFENMKKRRLAIKTPWDQFDKIWDMHLRLASLTMDNWGPTTSTIVEQAFLNRHLSQVKLAKRLKRTQSTISKSLTRAGYDEINMMLAQYEKQINQIINKL